MPDSLPPSGWGFEPFDDRDLEALLSGEAADVRMELRPVKDALTALCAPPTLAELAGEATIMAEFSALAEFRALGLSQAGLDGGQLHTLVLPVPPAEIASRQGRGPRHRQRRPARPVRRTGAVMIAAAAVLILVAVAVSLSGRIAHTPKSTPPAAANGGHNSASPQVQGNGAPEATTSHTATPTRSATPPPSLSALCNSVYGFLAHPDSDRLQVAAEYSKLEQLIKLAGGPKMVPSDCRQYVNNVFQKGLPGPTGPDSHMWRWLQDAGPLANQGTRGQEPAPSLPSPPAVNPALSTSNGSSSGQSR